MWYLPKRVGKNASFRVFVTHEEEKRCDDDDDSARRRRQCATTKTKKMKMGVSSTFDDAPARDDDDREPVSSALVTKTKTATTMWSQRLETLTLRFDANGARDVSWDVERASERRGRGREGEPNASAVDGVGISSTVVVRWTAKGGSSSSPDEHGDDATLEEENYAVRLELYGALRPGRFAEMKINARFFIVVFSKSAVDVAHWPRLLLSPEKRRDVVVDFDRWMDEDDERERLAAFRFNLSSLENISNYEDKEHYFPDVDDSDDDMPDMTDFYA